MQAGMRTNYVDATINSSEGKGFLTIESKTVLTKEGVAIQVPANSTVYITKPGQLIRGSEIKSLRVNGTYVLIGFKSSKLEDTVGYMTISNIEKPKEIQSRVETGSRAQNVICQKLQEKYGNRIHIISTAKTASQAADLVFEFDGNQTQMEIKSHNTKTSPITFFDKSIRRGDNLPFLDEVAATFSNGHSFSFEKLIDVYRETNPAVGFPGDEGTPKSGKLPSQLRITENEYLLDRFRQFLIRHFHEHQDTYFVVYNKDDQNAIIYYTGFGNNPLEAPLLPKVSKVILDTYGGAYKGAMRVALKIKLEDIEGLKLP